MRLQSLDILRCPFCGSRLSPIENDALVRTATHIESGVLGCECCAFPIVAGIPLMIADDATRAAMHRMESGDHEGALFGLLGLDDDAARASAFRLLLSREREITYRDAIAVLSPDAEGQYFIYRFSDPTFLLASAVLDALARHPRVRARKVLDLCGGSGHLTRVLAGLTSPEATILADLYFWKLWLAQRFTAPDCDAVCCNANTPLPFARETFSLVVCSDAFPYIWHKRAMAEEMMRLTGENGVVTLPHLHSALGENFTAGMTLTPHAYRELFAPLGARMFKDSELLNQLVDGTALDLARDASLEELVGESSLTLIATHHHELFRSYEPRATSTNVAGTLAVNPLYRIDRRNGGSVLTLAFPSAEYAEEFAECKRYLPDTVLVPVDLASPFDAVALGSDYAELRRRHIIIDAPANYL